MREASVIMTVWACNPSRSRKKRALYILSDLINHLDSTVEVFFGERKVKDLDSCGVGNRSKIVAPFEHKNIQTQKIYV